MSTCSGRPSRSGAGATWNSYDSINAWTTPGGDQAGGAQDTASINSTTVGGTAIWDVSALAQTWVRDAGTNNGMLLRARDETSSNQTVFGGPGGASVPELEIDWEARPGIEGAGTYASQSFDDRSGASVNVVSGNAALQSTDISLPGVAGSGLEVKRTYNTGDVADNSLAAETKPYGSGWTWTIDGAALYSVYVFPDSTARS